MDIKCVVCGEPWDSYGIKHGDMSPWEAVLFRAGAGCPSCEGVSNGWTPSTFDDIENGDEDPMVRLIQAENVADRPPWKRPDDVVKWTCEACDTAIVVDSDDGETFARGRNGYRLNRGGGEYDCHDVAGHKVCECCVETCDDCGCLLCSALSTDAYDGMASIHLDNGNETLCVTCYEARDFVQENWDAWQRRDVIRSIESAWNGAHDTWIDDVIGGDEVEALLENERAHHDGDNGPDGGYSRDTVAAMVAAVLHEVERRVGSLDNEENDDGPDDA